MDKMDNDDVVDCLNDLIETSKDGEYGFKTCAERATSGELKKMFTQRAQSCAKAATELQGLVAQHGGKAEDSGSMLGSMHRGWGCATRSRARATRPSSTNASGARTLPWAATARP